MIDAELLALLARLVLAERLSELHALIDLAPPEEPDLADLDQLFVRRRQWRMLKGT